MRPTLLGKTSCLPWRSGIAVWAALVISPIPTGWAQLPTQLPGGISPGQGGAGGLLGGLGSAGGGLPSVTHAGAANTAGVLQYCIQNNYLSGGAAGSAKTALLSQLPGSGRGDSGFKAGSTGLLQTGNGQNFNLGGGSGGGIKSQVTHKVCDLVLQHAKSLL